MITYSKLDLEINLVLILMSTIMTKLVSFVILLDKIKRMIKTKLKERKINVLMIILDWWFIILKCFNWILIIDSYIKSTINIFWCWVFLLPEYWQTLLKCLNLSQRSISLNKTRNHLHLVMKKLLNYLNQNKNNKTN